MVDNLKAKVLVRIDILEPEQTIINIAQRKLVLPICQDLNAKFTVTPKKQHTKKIVLASEYVTILANCIAAVLI